VFYSIPGVNQFQVIQNDRRHLIIRLLTVSNVDHGSLVTKVRESVRRIDAAFEIDFEFPRDIPVLPSGKRRYVYRTWESSTPNHIDEVAGLRSRKTPLNEGLERSTVMSFARYAEPLMWRASNRGAHRVLRALLNDMTADRAVLDRMVDERLHRLLSYAVHDVPFYGRDDLRRAVRTQSPRGALESFPVLAKTDVGRLEAQLRGSDLRGANTNHSGGSTGHILNFLQSPEHRTHAAAGRRATAMLCGWRPGMPVVTFFGNPAVVGQHRRRPGALLKDRLSRFYLLDAFAPDEATLHAVAARLARQPALLIGYASLLGHLARYLIERNQRIKTVAVQSTADTLPETLRQMLEQVFQAPVYNRYGSRELSIIGHEGHDQDGLYVFERNNLVEILDAAGRPCPLGVAGRIVVTNLNNRAMPFIRYEIGDVGYWHDDGPGVSNLKRLGAVLGRENDLILGPSGKAVYCEFFARLFYAAPGVKQFQVVQDGRTHLKIQIVADDTVDEQSLAAYLTDSIRRVADPEFEIDFEFPDDIATLPSGKRRYVYRTWQADMVDGVTQ
jgi:phenylacetate-CoA ligase